MLVYIVLGVVGVVLGHSDGADGVTAMQILTNYFFFTMPN